jgi:hypothetical protein
MFSPESPLSTHFLAPPLPLGPSTAHCGLVPLSLASSWIATHPFPHACYVHFFSHPPGPSATPPLASPFHLPRYRSHCNSRSHSTLAGRGPISRSTDYYIYCDLYLDAHFSHFIIHLRIIPSNPFLNFIVPVRSEPHNKVLACSHDKQRHHLACRAATFDDTQEQQ